MRVLGWVSFLTIIGALVGWNIGIATMGFQQALAGVILGGVLGMALGLGIEMFRKPRE
jgi:hypothetical protein